MSPSSDGPGGFRRDRYAGVPVFRYETTSVFPPWREGAGIGSSGGGPGILQTIWKAQKRALRFISTYAIADYTGWAPRNAIRSPSSTPWNVALLRGSARPCWNRSNGKGRKKGNSFSVNHRATVIALQTSTRSWFIPQSPPCSCSDFEVNAYENRREYVGPYTLEWQVSKNLIDADVGEGFGTHHGHRSSWSRF